MRISRGLCDCQQDDEGRYLAPCIRHGNTWVGTEMQVTRAVYQDTTFDGNPLEGTNRTLFSQIRCCKTHTRATNTRLAHTNNAKIADPAPHGHFGLLLKAQAHNTYMLGRTNSIGAPRRDASAARCECDLDLENVWRLPWSNSMASRPFPQTFRPPDKVACE